VFGEQEVVHLAKDELTLKRLREMQSDPKTPWTPQDYALVHLLQQQYLGFETGAFLRREMLK